MLKALLNLVSPAPPKEVRESADDDQIYSEAVIDNAIVESGRTIDRINSAAALGSRVNTKLREGIDRLKLSGVDSVEALARLRARP